MKFINMLLSHNIKPILVFDGQHLPAKALTEKKRRESRQSSRKRAAELLRAGRTDEARNFLRRCIDVTHEMALALMRECRRRNVDCIVAPYEADAQLAYLNLKNIADIVITEDSDLVLFGCSKILFKMDHGGHGLLVEQERLHLAMGVRPENFSFDKFRHMCILSGCDYLPSLPGIGLNKACKFVTRTVDPDIHRALTRLPGHLNMKSLTVTEEYRDQFVLADATFRYQVVFDPQKQRLVHLNEPPDSLQVTEYAGKMLPNDTAYQLALGNLDPFTLKKVDNFDPHVTQQPQNVKTNSWHQVPVASHPSIWSSGYKKPVVPQKPDPWQVERPSTKGKVVKKDVSFVIQSKRQLEEEVVEACTDEELTSMYFASPTSESSMKKMRPDDTDDTEAVVEKENSPVASPVKEAETTPVKQSPPPQLTSPVLASGKSRRNPFFKQSPRKETPESSWSLLGLRDTKEAPERKFSALSKFGKLRRTVIDETTVVQSRFFSKQTDSDARTTSVTEQVTESETKLRDVSNTCILSDVSPTRQQNATLGSASIVPISKPPSPVKAQKSVRKLFKSESKSFSWCQNRFGFQKSKSITTLETSDAVVRDFKSPVTVCETSLGSVVQTAGTEEEEEDLVDEPSPVDSGLEIGEPSSSPGQEKMSISTSMESVAVDEGFHSPSSSRVSQSVNGKLSVCRRPGLSKSSGGKQQSLLSMFGFQKKPKLQHA
ncbi:exonuclease 1 isoform X2 [Periplaneta americana]